MKENYRGRMISVKRKKVRYGLVPIKMVNYAHYNFLKTRSFMSQRELLHDLSHKIITWLFKRSKSFFVQSDIVLLQNLNLLKGLIIDDHLMFFISMISNSLSAAKFGIKDRTRMIYTLSNSIQVKLNLECKNRSISFVGYQADRSFE